MDQKCISYYCEFWKPYKFMTSWRISICKSHCNLLRIAKYAQVLFSLYTTFYIPFLCCSLSYLHSFPSWNCYQILSRAHYSRRFYVHFLKVSIWLFLWLIFLSKLSFFFCEVMDNFNWIRESLTQWKWKITKECQLIFELSSFVSLTEFSPLKII